MEDTCSNMDICICEKITLLLGKNLLASIRIFWPYTWPQASTRPQSALHFTWSLPWKHDEQSPWQGCPHPPSSVVTMFPQSWWQDLSKSPAVQVSRIRQGTSTKWPHGDFCFERTNSVQNIFLGVSWHLIRTVCSQSTDFFSIWTFEFGKGNSALQNEPINS